MQSQKFSDWVKEQGTKTRAAKLLGVSLGQIRRWEEAGAIWHSGWPHVPAKRQKNRRK